jgi:hypothetical protein
MVNEVREVRAPRAVAMDPLEVVLRVREDTTNELESHPTPAQ